MSDDGWTLLITTYQRTPLLYESLKRLKALTLPDEILIVDDGGSDACEKACNSLLDRRDFLGMVLGVLPIRYVYTHNPGWSNCCHARNVGVKLAAHENIIVSEPELLFLSDVVAQFKELRGLYPNDVLHEQRCLHEPYAGCKLEDCRQVPGFYVNCHRRSWLLEVGGWDEDIPGPWGWDDIDLYGRLQLQGHARHGFEEIVVRHQWHPSRIELAVENEHYVRSKTYPDATVANLGREWGVAKER